MKGSVSKDELVYMFQLAYQLLNRITDLDLISDPYIKQRDEADAPDVPGAAQRDQDYVFGCQAEREVMDAVFPPTNSDPNPSIDIRSVMMKLSNNEEVQRFF